MIRRPALSLLFALAATGAASPAAAGDGAGDAGASPSTGAAVDATSQLAPTDRLRASDRWALVDDGAAIGLGLAAFRLQSYSIFQNDARYGEIHPSCALMSCDADTRGRGAPTWDDVRLASTSIAFAALGIGATWLVTPRSERLGVTSLEIKLTTGGTTGLTLIGRF